ncbi:hypothetical protein HMPREF9946_00942 [Acetobacteraceae bacterium AT-5844]|nr:hypothetical protein HMPREF9946_00942 [Acetobacteraceae bacterium AT-5844]
MQWTKVNLNSRYQSVPGMDPRADWLLGPGIADFLPEGPEQPFPLLLRVDDEATAAYLNQRLSGEQHFFAASFGPGSPRQLRVGEQVSAFATKAFFDEMARQEPGLVSRLQQRIQFSLPMSRSAERLGWRPGQGAPETLPPNLGYSSGPWPEGTVIMAVIDDGIGFAHERFRRGSDKTRVEFFWNQDGKVPLASSVPFGREWVKAEIDALIGDRKPGGEDEIYRRAGMLDFRTSDHKSLGPRLAHGTHILDLAAGEDPARNCDNRPIIAVQLASVATADASGASIEHFVKMALEYVRARAKLLAGNGPPLPVVVNFSYSTQTGPHDGTAALEEFIDDLVRSNDPPMRIVVPAGNGHAARCHAEIDFSADSVVSLPWRVQPEDLTPSTLEIWMPRADNLLPQADRIRVSIVTPSGSESPLLGEKHGSWIGLLNHGEMVCCVRYVFVPSSTARGVFVVTLQPSARLLPDTVASLAFRVAPHGIWRIKLHNISLSKPDWPQAWIARDDVVFGYPQRGRQSYFDADCYARFDAQGRPVEEDPDPPTCTVRRTHMMNGIGTGAETIMAGGFRHREYRMATYSASGPAMAMAAAASTPLKPAAALVSDDTTVHAGVMAAGTRSGVRLAMGGTSVAAPRLSRWIATQLAASAGGDHSAVETQASAEEQALPKSTPPAVPKRAGWGRIGSFDPPLGQGRRYWP